MSKKIFAILLLSVFLVSFASAGFLDSKKLIDTSKGGYFEFDNGYKVGYGNSEINKLWETYKPIEIKSFLGKTKLQIALTEHTETCGEDCFSNMEIYLPEDGTLVDDVKFYTQQDDMSWNEQAIRSYQFSYWGLINDYETQCAKGEEITSENGTYTQETCEQVKVGSHYGDINYNLGDELPAGEYTLKLTGEKKPSRTVDWIIETKGEVLSSMAVWGEMDLVYDEINDSSINTILWDKSTTTVGASTSATVTEDGEKIRLYASASNTDAGGANTALATLNSKLLDTSMYQITTRVNLTATNIPNGDSYATLYLFGNTIKQIHNSGNDDSVWTFTLNGTNYDVYDDNVYQTTITPTNNFLNITAYATDPSANADTATADIFYTYYSSGNAQVTLNSPADDSISDTNEVTFNASATVTSGATLTNMSLWTNESGSWEEKNTTIIKDTITTQETANTTTVVSAFGSNWYNNLAETNKVHDNDFNTYGQENTDGVSSIEFIYTKPSTRIGATWTVKDSAGTATLTIPDSCFDYTGASVKVRVEATKYGSDYVKWDCYNGSWNNLRTSVGHWSAYEESINWYGGGTNSTQTWDRTITEDIIWNVQTCDSDGDCGFAPSNYTLSIDTEAPTILISSPESVIDTHSIGNALLLNTTITDTNLDTCWYDYNNTNNTFSCTSGVLSSESFNTFTGGQEIIVWANDSIGNTHSETTSWIYNFVENSATYDATAYETSTETLTLNFTTGLTIQSISSNLVYNGTDYLSTSSCEGSTCILNNSIDIPLLVGGTPVNNTFYWEFTIFNGTSSNTYNSTSRTQEVNNITLIECDGTYTTKALNFTAYDEGNLSKLEPFEFEGTFSYWLGSGSSYKSYSLTNTSTNEVDLCISPTDENFNINASIEYDSSALGNTYTKRSYYFRNHQINSTLQNIELLLLNSEDSTSFIQEVLEEQIGVENAYIYTYRYYPGEDDYKITQITKTDNNGETIGFYEAETANYKHLIYVDDVLRLEEAEGYKVIPSSTPYTITFYLGTQVETPWEVYDNRTGLGQYLTFNSDTKTVLFSYTDTNSTNEGGRLLVLQEKYATEDITISNGTSLLSSALLTSDISNYTGNFIAQAFVTRDGTEYLINSIRITIDDKRDTFGEGGVLLAWFIILVATMAFLYDAVIGLIAVNLAIIFVNLIGFVSFGLTYIFGILIVSITIMWLMKK